MGYQRGAREKGWGWVGVTTTTIDSQTKELDRDERCGERPSTLVQRCTSKKMLG
jgi:hypothetical protein